ncbi:MAG: putative metalloprotease CJM1_0395 family protein [Pseudomonadota bacterium]
MIGVGAIPQAVSLRQAAVRQPSGSPEETERERARSNVFEPNSLELSADALAGLSDEQLEIVARMKARDREVRAHEEAHKIVGGRYAGAISYDYQEGPDGQRYVVSGSVPIDTAPVPGDPVATIAKMEVVIAAALAPSEPSPQDRAVAQQARSTMWEAQTDVRTMADEEALTESDEERLSSRADAANEDRVAEAALNQNTPYAALRESDTQRLSAPFARIV